MEGNNDATHEEDQRPAPDRPARQARQGTGRLRALVRAPQARVHGAGEAQAAGGSPVAPTGETRHDTLTTFRQGRDGRAPALTPSERRTRESALNQTPLCRSDNGRAEGRGVSHLADAASRPAGR